jgi:hypothetical protein
MLTTELALRLKAKLSNAALLGVAPAFDLDLAKQLTLASGIIAQQADKLYVARHTIGSSATVILDVAAGGGLLDPFGAAFAIAKLKYLIALPDPANVHAINLVSPTNGVPFLGAAADLIPMHAGGYYAMTWPGLAAIPVTAGTGDLIHLVNTGATAGQIVDLILGGASA